MDEDERWFANVEKKAQEKNRMREVFDRYKVERRDWSCECGSKFKWYSIHHEERHMESEKHKRFVNSKTKSSVFHSNKDVRQGSPRIQSS